MKNLFRITAVVVFMLVFIIDVPFALSAPSADYSWTWPTTYADGVTQLPANSLDKARIYWDIKSSATGTNGYAHFIDVPYVSLGTYHLSNLTVGTTLYTGITVFTTQTYGGKESALYGPLVVPVPYPTITPSPCSSATVTINP